jgi:DNA modification methylase/ParB-like chromosome segregation protein Spo0J
MKKKAKNEKVVASVVRIKISDIIEDPRHSLIYGLNDLEDQAESMQEVGQKAPVHVSRKDFTNYLLHDGYRRLAAAKLLNWTEIDAIIVEDRDSKDFLFDLIHSNKHRVKTAVEKYNEIEALRKYYGNRRGFRSDLKPTSMNIEPGQTTMRKIAKDIKVKPCEVQKLERIAKYNRKYLEDIGADETLDQVYQRVKREQEQKKSSSKMKRVFSTVKKVILDVFFKIFVKSSINMSEVDTNSIQCICTSPPYYRQRRYSEDPEELGQEQSPALYILRLANHLKDCHRVLKDRGSMFLNLGDSMINKRQQLIPEKVAIELENQGWILRQRIIWRKTTSMYKGNHSSFTPQCESILWLVKSEDFDYNDVTVPIKTKNIKPGSYCHKNVDGTLRKGSPINTKATSKNMRDFWDSEVIETASCNQKSPFLPKGTNHTAPFPVEIPNICIAKVCKPGQTVLDPFCGSASTGQAAMMNGCNFIGYELIQKSANMAIYRLNKVQQHIASLSQKVKIKVRSIAPVQPLRKAA